MREQVAQRQLRPTHPLGGDEATLLDVACELGVGAADVGARLHDEVSIEGESERVISNGEGSWHEAKA